MKLRIKTNSIRYRLTRSDVARLAETGYIEDYVNFGEQQLIYALQLSVNEDLSSTFTNNKIMVSMPAEMIKKFTDTDVIGFENNDSKVHLLVEKDFTCMDEVLEDQSDNYPNPLLTKVL